jgi:spore coat polysaccharide biosynthesis predicted glycosyltransferase SpsG
MKSLFITNSGPDIGGGHLSRCFALSRALTTLGVSSGWVLNDAARPQAEALGITDASYLPGPFSGEYLPACGSADFAVADSYIPDADFYARVSERMPLVVIDDLHESGAERFADILINYGIGASRSPYGAARCKLLIGPRYTLLREDYWELDPAEGEYVMFAPGASDAAGSAPTVAGWWRSDWGRLVTALGPLTPGEVIAETRWAASGKNNVEILISPPRFPYILANAGRVICSASVTANEALAMEKPVAVFSAAENQRGLGKILECRGVAYDLGNWSEVTPDSIEAAIAFSPNRAALRGLVNKRGALVCAGDIVKILGGPR